MRFPESRLSRSHCRFVYALRDGLSASDLAAAARTEDRLSQRGKRAWPVLAQEGAILSFVDAVSVSSVKIEVDTRYCAHLWDGEDYQTRQKGESTCESLISPRSTS